MAETTIRIERRTGFTVLQNEMLRDPRLSLKAKGLMAILLGLPEEWQYSIAGLAKICATGKDSIRSALKEMEEAGYLERRQTHAEGGRFGGNVYIVRDTSNVPLSENPPTVEECGQPLSGNPMTVKPATDKPLPENPTQLNKQELNKQESNTPLPPKGEKRAGRFDLQEDAKPVLRDYVGSDNEMAKLLADFIEMRKELKAINSRRGISALLSQLDSLSGGQRDVKLRLIQQSLANSWKGIFPLKENGNPPPVRTSGRIVEERGTYEL